ncbi:MAG: prolipoprotein diacylglyceryl transferase [Deltaproteobacteria bacterium]|nr:prolipoprotein diacylglyceryl transferase [Deltaproteobacteria bacterium]
MIPYFPQPRLTLGPLTIYAFGLLVACAVTVGMKILHRRAAAVGLNGLDVSRFISWTLIGGFAGAHLVDRFVYFPADTLAHPVTILRFWDGLSSFGGFLGGTVGALLYFHRHAAPGTAWKYLDSFAYAFPFGWIFGRLGCFVAFDHPGSETQLFFGQTYKDGIVRHNLGLEEALYTMAIAAIFYVLGRKPRYLGFFMSLFLVLYAPFRFAVDFLRTVDVRYLGFTPGQYGCVALVVLGFWIMRKQGETRAVHDDR